MGGNEKELGGRVKRLGDREEGWVQGGRAGRQ
jgi:hypothetical protein